jgi:hypothetical protein
MLGRRRSLRLTGNFRVTWNVAGAPEKGDGIISNVSVNGMEMKTSKPVNFPPDTILLITPASGQSLIMPTNRCRVAWCRETEIAGQATSSCGLKFVK